MSDEVEPDWSLLPRDPAAFFGLSAGFDLRALKGAYGALLRRYKPEKAPEEFQKIRAAFESLKGRFDEAAGRQAVPPSFPMEFQWPMETPQPRKRPAADPRRDHPEKSVPRSLREEYEALRARDTKSPKDYYALALLADLVGDEGTSFAWWLHAGLRRHPDEPALARLLSEYLGTEEAAAHAEWLLVATSQAIPSDRFYDVSRPLWDRLLGGVDFATFRALVEACEANLDGDPGEGYVAFSWWVLRRAVWEQAREWFDARVADLESLGDDLMRWDAACDRDLVDFLIIYRQVRHRIVTKRFVPTEMDRTVIACTTSSQAAADRRMVEAQSALASHELEVLRDFRPDVLGVEPLVMLWEHLSAETANRLDIPALHVGSDEEARIREFAFSLLRIGWRPVAWLRAYWGYGFQQLCKGLIAAVWAITVIPAGIFAVVFLFENPGGTIGAVIFCTGVSYGLRWLWQLVAREQAATALKASKRLYRYVWRSRVIEFLRTTPVPISSVVNELADIARDAHGKRRWNRAARIAELVASDMGLRLLQIAARFRRGLNP
jgi:hypothetical protein